MPLISLDWRYSLGEEDLASARADCTGFVHIALVYLGYDSVRWSSKDWYYRSSPTLAYPSVVSVPGHAALLPSRDFVVELHEPKPGGRAVRTMSLTDWEMSNSLRSGFEVRYYPLKNLKP
jgi:hypothetical protein